MRRVNIARVETPTHHYVKARVEIEDGEPATVRVLDRKNKLLARVTGALESVSARRWTITVAEGSHLDTDGAEFLAASEGEVWSIEQRSGCGCGGTRVIER